MLILFAATVWGIFLALSYGWIVEYFAGRLLRLEDHYAHHFSVTILVGLAALSGLLGIWSLIWPVNLRALMVFTLPILLGLLALWRYISLRLGLLRTQLGSLSLTSKFILVLIAVYVLHLAASTPFMSDTALYHAQAIRWIETYHVVPGLANFNYRLGFNSDVFLLAAFFGLAPLGQHAYQVPSLLIFFSVLSYCLFLLDRPGEQSVIRLSIVLALGVIVFLLWDVDILKTLSSPATDLPTAMLSWFVFLLMMEKIESGSISAVDIPAIGIVLLSCLAFTFKLSAVILLSLPLLVFWWARAALGWRQLAIPLGLAGLVVLPWMAATVVLTGYLLYPLPGLDLFSFDWKVPPQIVDKVVIAIRGWARYNHQVRNYQALSLRLVEWVPRWYQSLGLVNEILIGAILIGFIFLVLYVFLRRRDLYAFRPYASLYAVAAVGVAYWFVEAPTPRFGLGYLVVLASLLAFAPVAVYLFQSGRLSSHSLAFFSRVIVLVFLVAALAQVSGDSWTSYGVAYRAYPVIRHSLVKQSAVKLNGLSVYYPVGFHCWYDLFPCAMPDYQSVYLRARGETLAAGFYVARK